MCESGIAQLQDESSMAFTLREPTVWRRKDGQIGMINSRKPEVVTL